MHVKIYVCEKDYVWNPAKCNIENGIYLASIMDYQNYFVTKLQSHPVNHCYPFSIKLDKCVGTCNTLSDLFNKTCIPNKTEDLNLSVFNIITR